MNFNQITLCQAGIGEITFCKWSRGKLINDASLVALQWSGPREAPEAQWRHPQSSGHRGPPHGAVLTVHAAGSFVFSATPQQPPKILVYEGVYTDEQHILLSFLDYMVSILGKADYSICRAQCKQELQDTYSKSRKSTVNVTQISGYFAPPPFCGLSIVMVLFYLLFNVILSKRKLKFCTISMNFAVLPYIMQCQFKMQI